MGGITARIGASVPKTRITVRFWKNQFLWAPLPAPAAAEDKVIGIKDGRAENRKNALTHFDVIVSAQPATDYHPGADQTND